MKNINMRRLILEDNTPTNTDKYPIKQIKGEVDPDTEKQTTYQIGLSDNLLVYRRMGDDGKFSGEWLKFDNQEKIKELKGKHYNLLDKDNNVISIFDDTPEKRASSSETKTKTKGKYEYKDIPLHKNKSHSIIPYSVYEYWVNGIPVEKTIRNHKNIFDFCAGVKAKYSGERGQSSYELHKINYTDLEIKKLNYD
jgi:hypothetical protein